MSCQETCTLKSRAGLRVSSPTMPGTLERSTGAAFEMMMPCLGTEQTPWGTATAACAMLKTFLQIMIPRLGTAKAALETLAACLGMSRHPQGTARHGLGTAPSRLGQNGWSATQLCMGTVWAKLRTLRPQLGTAHLLQMIPPAQ